MSKVENVLSYYLLCNKLKDLLRKGWVDWNVQKERIESVAEHVYGTQQLAIAMWSEYQYDIDIKKVIVMLAVHELEETVIGDLTPFQITKEEKDELGHKAVHDILSKLNLGESLEDIILEFDERKTPEAKFAFFCDKLECDLQCKLYDEMYYVDLEFQENNPISKVPRVKKLIEEGKSWSEMWMEHDRETYKFDEAFNEVSEYAEKHDLYELKKIKTR